MLEFLGHGIFLILGIAIGAGIMYAFELIMDWKEEKQQDQLARAFERIKTDKAFWKVMDEEGKENEKG